MRMTCVFLLSSIRGSRPQSERSALGATLWLLSVSLISEILSKARQNCHRQSEPLVRLLVFPEALVLMNPSTLTMGGDRSTRGVIWLIAVALKNGWKDDCVPIILLLTSSWRRCDTRWTSVRRRRSPRSLRRTSRGWLPRQTLNQSIKRAKVWLLEREGGGHGLSLINVKGTGDHTRKVNGGRAERGGQGGRVTRRRTWRWWKGRASPLLSWIFSWHF